MVEKIEEISNGKLISIELDNETNGSPMILLDRDELDAIYEFAKIIRQREKKARQLKEAVAGAGDFMSGRYVAFPS